MNHLTSFFHDHYIKTLGICLLSLAVFYFSPEFLFALDNDEESERLEQHFAGFTYNPETGRTATKGGNYTAHATPHIPTADQIRLGQANIKKTLKTMEGKPLTVGDTLKVYASAGEAGFHSVHGCHGDGDISPAVSRELGLGRQKFHEEVLFELAKIVEPQTKGLGINDFGSGADPSKINAKGDIDFTLYAKNTGVEAQWLVDQYNKLFRDLAKSRYGVDLTPGQMDIVAHRYDATIPDWRARKDIAEFEVKLRTGTALLRANPEAYFLEGAYLQQIMGRSVKPGKKTFTWYMPDPSEKSGIRTININASQVPQFFYVPKARAALGFGGAVGNYHFHYAHAEDFIARTKYILRSLDNGPGLLVTGKRGDYQDIGKATDITEGKEDPGGKQERRQIIEDLYNAPQMQYSKDLRDEIFEVYEICRKARIAKDKGKTFTDAQLYAGLMTHMKKNSLIKIDDAVALKLAQQTFRSTSEFILTANVIRTAKTRARDWLRPHTLKERISYEDENGNLVSVVAKPDDLKRLQFAAFREIHDAIQILQQDNKHHVIEELKQQNPILKKDIEIVENIIKKKREMMLTPENQPPEAAMSQRQKAAQNVIDSWEEMGKSSTDSSLWVKSIKTGRDAWATGEALEAYIYSNLTQALISSSGKKYGPVIEQIRKSTEETNKTLMNPIWMTRISRANSVVNVLTLYAEEGSFNERVIKEAVVEGLSHFPLIGMPIDIYRGTVSGLLNYNGDAKGLVKVTVGSGLGQIVLSQFIPGYGPVILVVNTAKGVVNLGGTVLFTPLKNQKIKLAYQGYLDPVDIEPGSPLYQQFLQQTGTEGIRNAITWWTDSTGRKDRIYSPRPSVLHPIDPEMKMKIEDRRKAVLAYFQPKIAALFEQRWGGAATVKSHPLSYSEIESEFLPKIMYKHVHEWWEGTGLFSAYDSLTVKRMMDEYYSDEMKSKLVQMLISDYIAGKGELIKTENEWVESLNKLFAIAAGYLESYSKSYTEDYSAISEAHKNAASQVLGLEQEEAEQIAPCIEILSSPRVILGKDAKGKETPVIERINIRAKIQASDTKEHPAPFTIGFKIKSEAIDKKLTENEKFSFEYKPDKIPESITVTAIAYDANNAPFIEHDVTFPIQKKKADSKYDGGESMEEIFDRLEAITKKAEEMAKEALQNTNKQKSSLDKASAAFSALSDSKNKLKGNLPEAEQHRQEVLNLIKSIENTVSLAEQSRKTLTQSVPKARQLSLEICQSLREIESESSRRAELLYNIGLKRQTLNAMLSTGRSSKDTYVSSIQTTKNQINEIEKKLAAINKLIDPSKDRLDEGKILDHLIEADIAGTAAKNNADTIKDIITDAKIEYAKGKSIIENRLKKSENKKDMERMDKLMERIHKADEKAQGLVSSLEGKVEKINKDLQSMSREIIGINQKIDILLKQIQETVTAKEALSQKIRALEAGQPAVENDLAELENAALDADICAESAQTTAQSMAQTADQNRKNQTDQRCNDITRQLNDAQQRGDLQAYQSLLNIYRDCEHFNDAVSIYNAMIQNSNDQYCNTLLNQLNDAQSRRDIAAYGALLNQAANCSFYNQALNIYDGIKNQRNAQALNTFLDGMAQILAQQNRGRTPPPQPPPTAATPPPPIVRPPPVINPPPGNVPQVTTGGGGMTKIDCEKKFCPVCSTGGSVDLLGVSVNKQCNDCRIKFKTQIEDCARGGVSVNRPNAGMSQFNDYRVLKCKVPVTDNTGRIIQYRVFYEFSGQSRKYPTGADCAAIGNSGTWEQCIDLARQYNMRDDTKYNVLP
jgi:hypothetical protein